MINEMKELNYNYMYTSNIRDVTAFKSSKTKEQIGNLDMRI